MGRGRQSTAPLRRAASPLALAARRLAERPGGPLLAAVGIAVGAAALAAALVSNAVVEDRAVSDAIARLPATQRFVAVTWVGATNRGMGAVDREARSALASLELGEPVQAIAFRTAQEGNRLVRIAGFDRPGDVLEARSGRLPSPCTDRACEAVVLDAPPTSGLLGLRVVGTAAPLGGFPVERLTGTPSAAAPVLVANGVDGLNARPELARLFRTLTWAVMLQPDRLDADVVDRLPGRITTLDTRLRTRSRSFGIAAPLDGLAAASERAQVASERQLLIAGGCTVLFVAFVVLAAARIRREAGATAYRVRRLGGRRWQVALEAVAFAALLALPALLVGWLVGTAVGALIARGAGESGADAARRSVLSADGPAVLALAGLVAVGALVSTIRARTLEIRGRRIGAVDMAIAGVLGVLVTALALGETDSAALARGDSAGSLLLTLPVLIALAGGLLTARLLGPFLRLAERTLSWAPISLRLAVLSLARNTGPAAVTVASLGVTAAMAVFAVSYDATLVRNQADAAAYAVPLDYKVTRDDTRAQGFGSRTELARSYGGDAVGVVRASGEAPSLNRRERLTVLGIPAATIPELRWRDDFSGRSPAELAREVADEAGGLQGAAIPSEAQELVLPRTLAGDPIRISASIRRPDGGFSVVDLAGETRAGAVRAPLPSPARGGQLVALTLGFPPGEEFTAAHRATGSRPAPDVFLRGMVVFGRPFAVTRRGRRPLAVDYREWVRSDGTGGAGGERGRLAIRYFLSQERPFLIRPKQPTDGRPIPVIASRSLADAAGGGGLPVRVGRAAVDVRVVATANRFPTLDGDFLVADRTALETATNAAAPGTVVADEAWLRGGPGLERGLRRAAPVPVTVASRVAIERRLREDPVARAVSTALLATVLVAALLALLGVLLTVALDARDNRAELFDLETLGLDPAGLARHLWLRSALVVAAGLVAGVLTGVFAALLVSDFVVVTANVTTAQPPLRAVLAWPYLAAGAAVFAVVALAASAALARSRFLAPAPDRPGTA